jgi:hypothetical protein
MLQRNKRLFINILNILENNLRNQFRVCKGRVRNQNPNQIGSKNVSVLGVMQKYVLK